MGEAARSLAQTGEMDAATRTRSGSTLSPEACFRAAVELARKHGSKSFELRSAVALGRELVERGRDADAREVVQSIRSQFVEGLDTRDVRDADGFLKTLT